MGMKDKLTEICRKSDTIILELILLVTGRMMNELLSDSEKQQLQRHEKNE